MIEKSFGECLNELLKIFNLKGSTLAKGINVDSSLIYKWLSNKRVPSYNSSHINAISNFLVNNITNSFQKQSTLDKFKSWSLEASKEEELGVSISDLIEKILSEAQGYSIEFLFRKNRDPKKNFIKTSGNYYINNPTINDKNINMPELLINNHVFANTDTVNIITGHMEVLHSTLHILEHIPEKTADEHNSILITLNSQMDLLPDYKEFNIKWKETLYKVINKGWTIVYLVNLNDNLRRTVKIIEDMQLSLSTGRYFIYYYKNEFNAFTSRELVIVPKIGALYCFSSYMKNQVDSAFFFKSNKSIEILQSHFSQAFSSAKPLLKSYSDKKLAEFYNILTESEENLGDRYAFKGEPSSVTLPIILYEKLLILANIDESDISQALYLYKKRRRAFKAQIPYYKFRDIIFKESIEQLIKEKSYYVDITSGQSKYKLKDDDIICHLENIIRLLKTYNNYEIALVNKADYDNISKIKWIVKENTKVFIESFNKNMESTITCTDSIVKKTNLIISEKDMVMAFRDYFSVLWNNIDSADKDKKEVINWIEEQVNLLKKS